MNSTGNAPEEVRPSGSGRGRQFRLDCGEGRVVIAEGGGETWSVYLEAEPENVSSGSMDGLILAEFLGYTHDDDYPDQFDEWADYLLAITSRKRHGRKA